MTKMTEADISLWRPLARYEEHFQIAHRWPLPTEIRVERDLLRYRLVENVRQAKKWVVAPGI